MTTTMLQRDRRATDREYRLFGFMFDELDHGIILFSAEGELHYANLWAQEILRASYGLRLVDGRITPVANFRARWEAGVMAACSGDRRLLFFGSGEQASSVAVMPLDSYLRETPRGLLMGIFGKRSVCEALTLLAFGRTNRLTAAEQKVLERLCEGDAPASIAVRLGIAESTVRSHIKSILSKTGSAGIRELLIVLTKLPPMQPRIKPAGGLQLSFAS